MKQGFEGIELFERTFQQQIQKNGEVGELKYLFRKKFGDGPDEWPVEPNRYRLIWMPGCPYANKAVISWKILGLDKVISLGTTGILRSPKGWVFSEDPDEKDPVLGVHYLHDIYTRTYPDYTGRSTVPTIVDTVTGEAANNDHLYIPTYFATAWKAYHKKGAPELYPEELRPEIDELNAWILKRINSGVYTAGFARSQEAYEAGYRDFFEAMDELDKRLEDRRFLFGDYITLSDIHLYVTLVRFFVTYYQLFRVNRSRLQDFKNLWPYARDLYQTEGFRDYTFFDLIKRHYQTSPHLRALFGNVYGIYAKGPDVDVWELPHGREALSGKKEKFLIPGVQGGQGDANDNGLSKVEMLHQAIERAGAARTQGEYENYYQRVFYLLDDLDEQLEKSKFLNGNMLTEADEDLYEILARFDVIYYFDYRLNRNHIKDFKNLWRFVNEIHEISEFKKNTDLGKIKNDYYKGLSDVRNPYHIVPLGGEYL
ncbi:MAG: glutathione S-transferase C-terminal domain-containing protein [Eubacteriales bacterium]|nr:glutathione S-transferase C-terminal domain-containing protein [Eubacteriales bacterium]